MKIRWFLIAALMLTTSCGKEIPGNIIQPDKMESILYDYHLAMGMSNNLKNTDKEAYKKYVFRKHRIDEALFDSSMVWYTREAQELVSIYENLEKRFKREHSYTEALLASRGEERTSITSPGDTVDIWNKEKLYWLTEAPLMNLLTFEFKSDSNFHAKDAFVWNLDFHFFAKGNATIGLNVIYENDSVIGETRNITESGKQTIFLSTDSTYKIKTLNGFIHVPENEEYNPILLTNNISLTRYHRLAEDSVAIVSPNIPQEMMEEGEAPEADETIIVEAEPEVETKEKTQAVENKKKPRTERLQKLEKRER